MTEKKFFGRDLGRKVSFMNDFQYVRLSRACCPILKGGDNHQKGLIVIAKKVFPEKVPRSSDVWRSCCQPRSSREEAQNRLRRSGPEESPEEARDKNQKWPPQAAQKKPHPTFCSDPASESEHIRGKDSKYDPVIKRNGSSKFEPT